MTTASPSAGPSPLDAAPSPVAGDALRRGGALVAAYLLFRAAALALRLPAQPPPWLLGLAFALSALASIGLPIGAIAAMAAARPRPVAALLAAAGGVALWLGLGLVPARGLPVLGAALAVGQDLGKIVAAAGIGTALASALKELNLLLPAGIFAAFADFVVVNYGTVKHALAPGNTKGQALVKAVSAQVPALHPSLPVLTIGPADFLFLGVFLACAARFGMSLRRTAWTLALVLAASLVLVPVIGNVPALAPMSIAFVAVNWRHFRLTRDEVISTLVVLVLVGLLFVGYFRFLYARR